MVSLLEDWSIAVLTWQLATPTDPYTAVAQAQHHLACPFLYLKLESQDLYEM